MKNVKANNKGFSLVELIIVIAIMAILVGVLAPQYLKYVEKSRKSTDVDNIDVFEGAVTTACSDETEYGAIAAGEYTLTFTAGDSGSVTLGGSGASQTEITNAFNEIIGTDWATKKLKSSKWTPASIVITITIDSNGNATFSSNSDMYNKMVSSGTTKTTTSGS